MSFPFLTILIIQAQANKPEAKAATNPINKGIAPMVFPEVKSPPMISRKAAPKIGTRTIKNEKRATSSLLVFSNKPVAMVDPLLEIPGSTAKA